MYSSPSFLTVYVIAASLATIVTLLLGLRAAIRRARLTAPEQRGAFGLGTTLLVGWFFVALVSSWLGLYQGTDTRIPTIEFGLLLPIMAGVILYWRSPLLRRVAAAASQGLIVGIQIYRMLGVIFLILLASGSMPRVFALPAGAGDVAVGLIAPVAALAFTRGWAGSAELVRAWNLLGLADLAVAVTTGFLSSPSPLQLFAFDNPNTLITAFPLVLIPVFLVPLAVLLHFASLAKLGWKQAPSHDPGPLVTEREPSMRLG